MPLTKTRTRITRRVSERLFTMRAVLQRNANFDYVTGEIVEVAPGERAEPDWVTHPTAEEYPNGIPCYFWNYTRIGEGEYTYPERHRIAGDFRMFIPHGLEIHEEDRLLQVYEPDDSPMLLVPIGIRRINPHTLYQLVYLDEVR